MGTPRTDVTITVLGSGTGVPSLERSACAVLARIAGQHLLFDIGPGTLHRMLEAGVTIFDIDYLFISHFHPDHTGELVSFLFATKYPDIRHRKTPLVLVGGPGITAFYEQLNDIFRQWIELPGLLEIIEIDPGTKDRFDFDRFSVTAAPMAHRPESLAYRITTPAGTRVVYSGDTDYTEHLVRLAGKADLLICESALPDEIKIDGHLTPSLAGKIATAAGVKKLLLTHFYPESDRADIEGQCRKTYAGPLLLARDLMKIEFTEPPTP